MGEEFLNDKIPLLMSLRFIGFNESAYNYTDTFSAKELAL